MAHIASRHDAVTSFNRRSSKALQSVRAAHMLRTQSAYLPIAFFSSANNRRLCVKEAHPRCALVSQHTSFGQKTSMAGGIYIAGMCVYECLRMGPKVYTPLKIKYRLYCLGIGKLYIDSFLPSILHLFISSFIYC